MLKDQLNTYLRSPARNKIVFHQESLEGIQPIDIGISLSRLLERKLEQKNLPLIASDLLDTLLNTNTQQHPEFGKILSIKNLGILLESELRMDFQSLLNKYSFGRTLFVQWEGEIKNNKLHFISKGGSVFDLRNISHIVL